MSEYTLEQLKKVVRDRKLPIKVSGKGRTKKAILDDLVAAGAISRTNIKQKIGQHKGLLN